MFVSHAFDLGPTCRGDFCLHYTPMTWQAAEDVCKNNNGHLAAVRNTSINTQIVLLMLGAVISQVWIGAELQLGNWTWVNGESYNGKSLNCSYILTTNFMQIAPWFRDTIHYDTTQSNTMSNFYRK